MLFVMHRGLLDAQLRGVRWAETPRLDLGEENGAYLATRSRSPSVLEGILYRERSVMALYRPAQLSLGPPRRHEGGTDNRLQMMKAESGLPCVRRTELICTVFFHRKAFCGWACCDTASPLLAPSPHPALTGQLRGPAAASQQQSRMLRRSVLILAAWILPLALGASVDLLPKANPEEVGLSSARLEKVTRRLQQLAKKQIIPGGSFVVVR
jgi:hypothetical protein